MAHGLTAPYQVAKPSQVLSQRPHHTAKQCLTWRHSLPSSTFDCEWFAGDCNVILKYCFQTTAQYILVIEKDVRLQPHCASMVLNHLFAVLLLADCS